jgi:hypothetical protein
MGTLAHKRAKDMLALQAKNQEVVHPEWRTKGWPFLRAAVIEAAESFDHYGWKWWKAQSPDLPQVQMELIDIWHFYLSDVLVKNGGVDASADDLFERVSTESKESAVLFDGTHYQLENMDFLEKMELIIGLAVSRRIHFGLFESAMKDVNLDWSSLFTMFVGKNVLNQFRQAHGYKQGTYIKMWHGEEDNVHLARILDNLKDREDVVDTLWSDLGEVYKTVS